jgi:hypothetical protein
MTRDHELLKQAVSEIRLLRTENRHMAARLDMFDKCFLLFNSAPAYQGQVMAPDLTWEIEKHIEQIAQPEGNQS